jgi:DNA-binding transcriptional LysR family regulator
VTSRSGLNNIQQQDEGRSQEGCLTIRKIDLNLFKVFDAILQHRSVSAAARELSVTPSAVSHALARLRRALDDELFVAGETGMEPTARALALAPGIRQGLGQFASAVDTGTFVPARTERVFRIAASDYVSVFLLPPLVARLAQAAPQAELRIFPFSRLDVVRELDEGRLDLALGWFSEVPARMGRTIVLQDSEAIVVRPGHPLTAGPVTKARLFAFPHVVVELTGTEDLALDGFLDERGVARRIWIERLLLEMADGESGLVGRVAVSVPHYAAVAPILRAGDLVATLPRRLALHEKLAVLELPYQPLAVNVEAIWHQRAERDAGLRWLIGEMQAAIAQESQD